MSPPLTDMAVFVEVVEQASFTAAAEVLGLSKAAVSRYVSRLERHLGVRLLNRTTRRLTLTEAGSALHARLKPALADVAAAEAELLELGGAPRGRLRVTAPAYFAQAFFMRCVSGFLRRYPEIELEIEFENRIVYLVKERYDVAIRITTLASSSLVARRLASVKIVTVASPRYLARRGLPKKPADLREHAMLAYTPAPTPDEIRFQDAQGRAIGVRVKGNFRCNNDDAIRYAALEDLGIATFPDLFVREELAAGTLVRVLDGFELPPAALCAVFPTRENLAPKVRVFVDFLAQTFAPGEPSRQK
ncbi:MAG TPA: LysR family transcriptional regulator [Gammaproteobacteria bacterium]|nr:LysR family transcriptional regulator [Gammaproteobacteria bacterium]